MKQWPATDTFFSWLDYHLYGCRRLVKRAELPEGLLLTGARAIYNVTS